MQMLVKKVAVRMPFSWATDACLLGCGRRLVENEAQETEGSRAESLKETERDGREPWQQSCAGSISH